MTNGKEKLIVKWLHDHESWLRQLLSTRWLALLIAFAIDWYVVIESVNMWKKTGDSNFNFAIWITMGVFILVIWYVGNRTYEHKNERKNGKKPE